MAKALAVNGPTDAPEAAPVADQPAQVIDPSVPEDIKLAAEKGGWDVTVTPSGAVRIDY